ncbi:MAG: ParA family protein [Bacteroidales bacterium]|nr:ParA family protein [Bacteroidales bacterium]
MTKTNIITIANTKGGTGKTTTCLNLATEFSNVDKKTLLIDFDPQGSLGKAILGEENLMNFTGVEELLVNPKLEPTDFISETKIKKVSIIPCHSELNEVSLRLLMNASFFSLKDILNKIASTSSRNGCGFDFILIDTQPAKNILMLNAFTSSDCVLIPTNPSVYPLMDIVELEQTIKSSSLNSNPDLKILGVLITMVQRATVYKQLENDLRKYFKDKVFETTITRMAKSEESAVEGVGVSELDPKCKLSQEYKALCAEILHRLNKNKEEEVK